MAGDRKEEPFQADEGSGMDAPYKARREQDKRALDKTEAGPKSGAQDKNVGDKNPDNEFADPGSAASLRRTTRGTK
jgi:hypothetical protein